MSGHLRQNKKNSFMLAIHHPTPWELPTYSATEITNQLRLEKLSESKKLGNTRRCTTQMAL